MRWPQSPAEAPRFPVTGVLVLLCLAASCLALRGHNVSGLLVNSSAFYFQFWRLVTATLVNASWFQLAFSLYWLWALGTIVEEGYGSGMAARIIGLFAAATATAQFATDNTPVGMAGVAYALFGYLCVAQPREARFSESLDKSTKVLFGAWFVGGLVARGARLDQVANVAQAVGMGLGVMLGYAMHSDVKQYRHRWAMGVAGACAAILLCATALREYVCIHW